MKNGILDSLRKMGQSHPSIAVVYLFGSQATGKRGPLSDVDCAVLLKNGVLKLRDLFSFRLELIGEMMHACRRSDVDLILLNEAPLLLAYEVIRSGRVLYERNHDARVAFEARTLQRYLDLQPFYRVGRSYLKNQLLAIKADG